MITGVIARRYGPTVAGLFLAFPAILPAAATLIEKHERQKKETHGLYGEVRGRGAAALDAAGAAMGSVGLLGFAGTIWHFVSHHAAPLVLIAATVTWAVVSLSVWMIRRYRRWLRVQSPDH